MNHHQKLKHQSWLKRQKKLSEQRAQGIEMIECGVRRKGKLCWARTPIKRDLFYELFKSGPLFVFSQENCMSVLVEQERSDWAKTLFPKEQVDSIREVVVALRGQPPAKCDFCNHPSDYLHPEEGGDWACIDCINRWNLEDSVPAEKRSPISGPA